MEAVFCFGGLALVLALFTLVDVLGDVGRERELLALAPLAAALHGRAEGGTVRGVLAGAARGGRASWHHRFGPPELVVRLLPAPDPAPPGPSLSAKYDPPAPGDARPGWQLRADVALAEWALKLLEGWRRAHHPDSGWPNSRHLKEYVYHELAVWCDENGSSEVREALARYAPPAVAARGARVDLLVRLEALGRQANAVEAAPA